MIGYLEALSIIKNSKTISSGAVTILPLAEACGRVCGQDILAPLDVQPFDNSAMDGYAVSLADVMEVPVVLDVCETIAAGDISEEPYRKGGCAAIMTGAMVPEWAEVIIPVEQAVRQPDGRVLFSNKPRPGDHIRRRGQDFQKGILAISKGARLTPGHIMALAALGYKSVPVLTKPKTCFIATGRELQEVGTAPLAKGKIYNANMPYAVSELSRMGADCAATYVVADNPEVFSQRILESFEAEYRLIISSGAVSAGQFDFVRHTLETMGAEILFHKVAIKPGKPILLARFPNGVFYFGLPGNPAATAAGLRFFVQPFLGSYFDVEEETPNYAILDKPFVKKNDLRLFLKARVESQPDGRCVVTLLEGQESFMISPFLHMNVWAVIPEMSGIYDAGTPIEIYPLQR